MIRNKIYHIVDKDIFQDIFQVRMYNGYEFNVENMKKYDITDEFKKII